MFMTIKEHPILQFSFSVYFVGVWSGMTNRTSLQPVKCISIKEIETRTLSFLISFIGQIIGSLENVKICP